MANVVRRKIKPSVAWDDKGTCPTANGNEAQSKDNQTNMLMNLQCDGLGTESVESDSVLSRQSELREDPLSRGAAQKCCQWLSDTQEAVDANVASPLAQDKHSTVPSSKKICKLVKLQQKKSCPVLSVLHENRDLDHSAVSTVDSTVVSLCLPPGCIPSEVIAQVPTKDTYSTPREISLVPLNKGWEGDPWINNICAEARALTDPAEHGMIFVPGLSALTVVHDLKEDIVPENNKPLASPVLEMFLQNRRVVCRRNAICEELEMITGFVKINGAKFSLWNQRIELQNIKNCR